MEIERKWMVVPGWPEGLQYISTFLMRQGYLHADSPIVRIREEALCGGKTEYVLCVKSRGTLAREEIELRMPREKFDDMERVIGLPLIKKERRNYRLPGGLMLEVNHVDEGLPSEFWYAEIEFDSKEQALEWSPDTARLGEYLCNEVTGQPGQSMAGYWIQTRITQR